MKQTMMKYQIPGCKCGSYIYYFKSDVTVQIDMDLDLDLYQPEDDNREDK